MPSKTSGTLTIYTQVDTTGVTKGLNGISKMINNISNSLRFAFGIAGFLALGKSAIDAASDLQEYQNVADVTFGKLVYKLKDFNKIALESYGMSELMATQAASGFMAMGNAAGLGKEESSEMAIELTKLVGDFASFYNLSHERARTALAAVYTGETETLKQYGTMLQEVNLQQYENEYGLGRSVKTMSAAEKAQLRYNYILHVNKDVIGDFVRTQENWANQVRVLGERFKQLLITIGNGLVTVLTPFVKVMNDLITATIKFANTVGDALTMIFGIEWQDLTTQYDGIADSSDTAADAQDKLADSTEKATKAAKKALQPWDKLNIIQTESADSVSTNTNIDTGDMEDGSSALEQTTQKIWSSIDTLYELGEYLGKTLQNILDNIDWMSAYQSASDFGTGLAEFLNGLISPETFGSVGTTIAGALNVAINSALALFQEFDFTGLGDSLAQAVNDFFATFDFTKCAAAINSFVLGIRDALITFLNNVKWSDVLNGIGDFIKELKIETVAVTVLAFTFPKLIKTLTTALAAAVAGQTIKLGLAKVVVTLASGGLLDTTDLLGRLLDTFALVKGGAAKSFGEAFSVMFPGITKALLKITKAVTKVGTGVSKVFTSVGAGITKVVAGVKSVITSISSFIAPIASTIAGVLAIIGGAVLSIFNFVTMLIDGFSWLNEILMVIGAAIAAVGAVILGAPAAIAAAVAAIVAAVMTAVVVIKDNWTAVCEFFSGIVSAIGQFFVGLWNGIVSIFTTLAEWFNINVITPVATIFEGLVTRLGQFFEGCWLIIQAVWIVVSDWFNTYVITPIADFFSYLGGVISSALSTAWDTIVGVWNSVSTWFNTYVIQPVSKFFADLGNSIKTIWNNACKAIKNTWESISSWFDSTIIKPLGKLFTDIGTTISNAFSSAWSTIKGVWNGVSSWFDTTVVQPVVKIWKDATNKIAGFFSDLWKGIATGVTNAMNAVITTIEGCINWIIGAINGILSGFNEVASWAAGVVGQNYGGVDLIPKVKLKKLSVPKLATGAVIPPNKEFMAILGDQKHGTNIEAPLDTIKQALAEVLAQTSGTSDSGDIVINIDGREVFRAVRKQDRDYANRHGQSAFVY